MLDKIKEKISGDTHLGELIKASATSFFLKMIGVFFSYLLVLYITNHFGAEEYGQYAIAMTLLSIAIIIPKFGLETSLVRIIGALYSKGGGGIYPTLGKAFFFSFLLSILFSSVVYFYAGFISELINKPDMERSIKTISFAIIPMVMISLIAAIFQAIRKVSLFVFLTTVITPFIFIILLFLTDFFGRESQELLLIYLCSSALSFLISLILFIKLELKSNSVRTNITKFTSILKISFPMLLTSSFVMLMMWTDILMLSYFTTEADVGVYSVAQKVAGIISISLMAVNAIAAPKFVQFYSNNDLKGFEKIVKQSTKLIFYTSLPALLVIMLFSKELLSMFGDEFVVGYAVLIILTIGQFINASSGSVGYVLQMTDRQTAFQYVILFASVVNVILNYALIPKYGINGAAYASMGSMILWNIILVIYVKMKLGFYTVYIPYLSEK